MKQEKKKKKGEVFFLNLSFGPISSGYLFQAQC